VARRIMVENRAPFVEERTARVGHARQSRA
jgi:hypothetical protein